jgi:cystathionine beta-lyase
VLADEIHCDFVNKGAKYTPFASLPNKAIVNNSLTFKAASKSFSLAAMKAAWFFSDNMDYIARVKANNRADLTTLGMLANRAALTEGEDWLDQCVAYIDGNHDFVSKFVAANIPSLKVAKPQGTYLAWLDVSQVVDRIDAARLAAEANRADPSVKATPETMVERFFVKNAKVQMNAGSNYGFGGAGRMRMNVATSRKLVELALTNLARALKST